MRLYNSPISPFGARVLIAARVKGLDIEQTAIPRPERRLPAYLALNPVAKIPVLITDEGLAIPESEAILRYLEDRFPDPSLRPSAPDARARMNLLIRFTDLYVMTPVIRLFPHLDPATRDPHIVASEIGQWKSGLASLAHFLAAPIDRPEAGVSLADCVLAPSLHLCGTIADGFGLGDLLAPHPALSAYYAAALDHPILGEALAELSRAQAAYR